MAAAAAAAAEKTTATMRAWLYSTVRNGIENSLELNETAARPPWPPAGSRRSNQVLVRVHFASLNPVDYKLAEIGLVARAMISVPASPGLDFSGVVAALPPDGEEEDGGQDLKVGDRVFGRLDPTRFGALGEYVVADREGLAKVPSAAAAASPEEQEQALQAFGCIGTAGLTAYQCIAPNVAEGRGDRVFINGGSGGTGTFGIQIAKALGCWVVATCSTANVELCKRLGADVVVDYKTQDVTAVLRELASPGGGGGGGKFKLVVDNVGTSPRDLYPAADDFLDAATGKFVQVAGGFTLTDAKAVLSRSLLPGFLGGGRRSFSYLMVKNRRAELERLGAWIAEGKIEAVIDGDGDGAENKVFDNAVVAFRKLKTGRVKGKLVVRVAKEAATA